VNVAKLRRMLVVTFVALAIACGGAVAWALADSGSDDAATAGPRINDHWHAALRIVVREDVRIAVTIPSFSGPQGVHTHGDDIIHIHPATPGGEGRGAAIGKFFEYGGGILTEDAIRIPGQAETVEVGGAIEILRADSGIHPLAGGESASFRDAIAACDAKPETEFEEVKPEYVPQDGDCIRIVFTLP